MTETSEWQPIESAPAQGEWVLLYLEDGSMTVGGRFNDDPWALCVGAVDLDDDQEPPSPTHWMPLPAPPETKGA